MYTGISNHRVSLLVFQIEDVEALLAGRQPEGRPVEVNVTQGASGGAAGGDGSKACVIQ